MNSQGSKNNQTKSPCLRIIPLGGLGEIGKNTCVFEYGDDIMILDAGLAFPTDGMHGVNVVMPDTTYLRENQNRIRGLVVTHGHEDHIGGISHHLKNFNIPIVYGPPLAMSMLRGKWRKLELLIGQQYKYVDQEKLLKLGNIFQLNL
jgi:ribonuclease J